MSTKSTIQGLINSIADGEENTALEVRTAYNSILNELFPTVYATSNFSNVKTASLTGGQTFSFIFAKSGNKVTMSGVINILFDKPENTNLFQFTDSEYYGKNNGTIILYQTFDVEGYRFRLTDGIFSCVDALPSSKSSGFAFNITYFTND